MSSNTELWDRLGKTDPAHTKGFKRAGGFSGTAIKPMWSYHRLTEEFGPCGTGWGVDKPDFQVVIGDNKEVLVFCTVSGWYMRDEARRVVFGVGGDKVVSHIKANEQYKRPERWENDDEAFKKAFTDALTNAFKLVGVGADVHMGMFDDNKYVNDMRREYAEEKSPPPAPKNPEQPKKPASSATQKRGLSDIDTDLLDCRTVADVKKCADIWQSIAATDGWSRDYKIEAKKKFDERRAELTDVVDDIEDTFPGSQPTRRRVEDMSTLEAG